MPSLARKRLLGRCRKRLGLFAGRLRHKAEAKSGQMPDVLPFDHHVAAGGNFRFQHCVLSQTAHEDTRPPVNKPLGKTLV
jgi:hypothetical protein